VFTFGNNIPGLIDAPIYGLEENPIGRDWANAKWGNTPSGLPPGTQVYGGEKVENWSVILRAGPGILTSGWALFASSSVALTIGSGASAGYFPTTTVEVPRLDPSQFFTVQALVWDSQGGTVGFEQAYNENVRAAASALLVVKAGDIVPLQSFSAGWLDWNTMTPYIVPEPGLLPLVTLGAGCVWSFRRYTQGRKQTVRS
jgi:hypothetical protein